MPTPGPRPLPNFRFETDASVSLRCRFVSDRFLSKLVDDFGNVFHRIVESFLNKYSENEGYVTNSEFRALQHFTSTALSVLSTQRMTVAASATTTSLPTYASFAKGGNLSHLFSKGEAISTLFNVLGLGVRMQLASTICLSIQGKEGKVPGPEDLRYKEYLMFPGRVTGRTKIGRPPHKIHKRP